MGLFSDEPLKRGGGSNSNIPKKGRGPNRAQLVRVTNKAPEVMVKITGYTKGSQHLGAHVDYIARDGELPLMTSEGQTLSGRDDLKAIQESWGKDLEPARQKRKGGQSPVGRRSTRITTNLVLSIPKGDPNRLVDAAQGFAKTTFHNHDWVMALHTDTDHPHVHLTIRNLGHDGRRLNIPNGKVLDWREDFAESLREQGIEAEATRRAERGVTRKGDKQAIRHMRKRLTPRVDKQAVRQATERLAGKGKAEPWKDKILARQHEMRGLWERVGQGLAKSPNPEDQALGKQALEFRRNMPPVQTRQDALMAALERHQFDAPNKETDRNGGHEWDTEAQR